MQDMVLKYKGDTQIYLQGTGALEVTEPYSEKVISYFVGSPDSLIKVQDYRGRQVRAAQIAIQGQGMAEFAKAFNEPAFVEIHSSDQETEIVMREPESKGNLPTLWLGVFEDNRMPVQPLLWKILKRVDDSRVAFAALIRKPAPASPPSSNP